MGTYLNLLKFTADSTSFNGLFKAMVVGTPEQQGMASTYRGIMESRLSNNPELISRFVPSFTVGCRRLTPGDGYLEALQQPNVRCIWSPISCITPTGIKTAEGPEDFDMIVTATGFDVSYRPSWNLVGRNETKLQEIWKDNPTSYFGVCAPEHPNYFLFAGPNTPVAHGVLPGALDQMAGYMLKWCYKIATEDIK
jgi:cation diffusion facilitator CzcD-associated flavoprotein CzcO